ncbi:hypothetical protein Ddc_06152 [Ditylenchus destructor]|nr:hypothetical protein Ddc_06152 [Ditylenchus destructor]
MLAGHTRQIKIVVTCDLGSLIVVATKPISLRAENDQKRLPRVGLQQTAVNTLVDPERRRKNTAHFHRNRKHNNNSRCGDRRKELPKATGNHIAFGYTFVSLSKEGLQERKSLGRAVVKRRSRPSHTFQRTPQQYHAVNYGCEVGRIIIQPDYSCCNFLLLLRFDRPISVGSVSVLANSSDRSLFARGNPIAPGTAPLSIVLSKKQSATFPCFQNPTSRHRNCGFVSVIPATAVRGPFIHPFAAERATRSTEALFVGSSLQK